MTPAHTDVPATAEPSSIRPGVPRGADPAEPRAPRPAFGSARGVAADAAIPAVIVAAITLGLVLVAVPNWPVGVFQDDGIYVILAKALAGGDGYRYINLPGAPHATHFPPGYPLFLALLWKLSPGFPGNVAVFTFANAGFLALAAYGTFRFARERLGLSPLGAGTVAVTGTASVPALVFGVYVLSEPMFTALLLLVLMLSERAAERGGWREAIMAGVAGGALAMVRTLGMFVVPALMIVLLVRRRWLSALAVAAGCAVFVVPWNLWVAAHGDEVPSVLTGKYGPYGTWLTAALRDSGFPFVRDVVIRNVRILYDMTGELFAAGASSPAALHVAAALAATLLLAAGARRLARRAPVTAWFLAAYMALVIIWPFEPVRFVWALLPIFGATLALGLGAVLERKPGAAPARAARLATLGVCVMLGVGFAGYNVMGVRMRWRDTVPRATSARATPVVEWVRASTRPTDVIAMEDDPLVYLYTGRRAVPIGTFTPNEYLQGQTYAAATQHLHTIIAHYRPTYVIGTTSYGVISGRNLSRRTPPELRVHALLPTAAIFTPLSR